MFLLCFVVCNCTLINIKMSHLAFDALSTSDHFTFFIFLQTEIVKRMSAIIGQVLPFLSQEHQQQVATAVERAKQVTMSDLNSVVGVSICIFIFNCFYKSKSDRLEMFIVTHLKSNNRMEIYIDISSNI